MDKLIICGFSGAGKSYALLELAKLAGANSKFHFWDLDQKVCEYLNIRPDKLGSWIDDQGIEVFRQLESKVLEESLQQENLILALGAGALNNWSIDLIEKNKIRGIWLNIPFEICWSRIYFDSNRPMAKLGYQKMLALYNERLQYYRRFPSVDSLELLINKVKDLIVLPDLKSQN